MSDREPLTRDRVIAAAFELADAEGVHAISMRKVALITPADSMNRNAANALLKTLEEPPGNTVMILVAHQPSRLPVTVRSRCQGMVVALPDEVVARAWLIDEQQLDESAAREALRAAGGSPIRALSYHEQGLVSLHGELDATLDRMFTGEDAMAAALHLGSETEPDIVWRWLSEFCTRRARGMGPGNPQAVSLLGLQQRADRFRALARTTVRGDLLLREWLIEWSRAGARAGSQGSGSARTASIPVR